MSIFGKWVKLIWHEAKTNLRDNLKPSKLEFSKRVLVVSRDERGGIRLKMRCYRKSKGPTIRVIRRISIHWFVTKIFGLRGSMRHFGLVYQRQRRKKRCRMLLMRRLIRFRSIRAFVRWSWFRIRGFRWWELVDGRLWRTRWIGSFKKRRWLVTVRQRYTGVVRSPCDWHLCIQYKYQVNAYDMI